MALGRPFALVDVFGATDFKGNPLAVVLDGAGLDTAQMQAITQWFNLSETTFLSPPSDPAADYKVRIFTLEHELPFAGHPTLGSCHAWLQAGGQPKQSGVVVQECGAGLVKIKRCQDENGADQLAFAAPPRTRTGPLDDATLDDACAALQITRADIIAHEWLINGPTWAGVMLKSAAAVRAVKPLGSWHKHFDIGLVGLSDSADIAYEVRAIFTNHNGTLVEDPVTGSLNAGVAQWLLGAGRVTAPYSAAQGTCIGRQGRIAITQDADGVIWVGGATKALVSGEGLF